MIGTDVEGERFYTIPEVARILRVSDQSVRRWIKAGQLRATKPGKEYRIGHTNLEEFLRAREPRPKAGGRSSREPTLFNGLEVERRESIYQHTLREIILQQANRIAAEADDKGYEPGWILEISENQERITRILLDNGVLGNRETYPTAAEYHQSWEIADALTELGHAVDRAWRGQMRVSEQMEQRREADQLRELREKREADKSSKEARKLEDIREERRGSA